jgi:hypothetical protein
MMMKIQPANPGGMLAPDEVVGREELTTQLWRILERRSIYLTAERRMGKTSVIRDKMGKATPATWTLIYLDVSRAVSPLEFIQALLDASRKHLDAGKKAKFAFYDFVGKLSNVDFKAGIGVKLPDNLGMQWKALLETLARDLASLTPRVVLAFDELPLMLDAIKRREGDIQGESLVMELLDTLRAIRQETDLRMIYTGSLGIHHVITVLREQGYQNDPTNDMMPIDLPPLTPEDAAELARRLLLGEGIACDNREEVAAHLAEITAGIPYYIQHLAANMGLRGTKGTIAEIDRCLNQCLTDPLDPWHLNYYDERIDTHYLPAHRAIARAVLDQLAVGEPKTLDELTDAIDPAKLEPDGQRDAETVRRVLRLLGMDHYVTAEENRYRFRNAFIKRIWRSRRGI